MIKIEQNKQNSRTKTNQKHHKQIEINKSKQYKTNIKQQNTKTNKIINKTQNQSMQKQIKAEQSRKN